MKYFVSLLSLISLSFQLAGIAHAEIVGKSSSVSSFIQVAADEEDKILSPDEAFQLSIKARDSKTLIADFNISPGHYLYKQRIKFQLQDKAAVIQSVELPQGESKQDPNFGATIVYHHDFSATIILAGAAKQVTVLATYQGCSEKGLCYSPIHKTVQINLPDGNSAQTSSTSDDTSGLFKSGKLWLIALNFFGFGLLLSLTPCVLPMIPILSGIIVGSKQEAEKHRLHSFNLSLAYSLGMALSYTLAGIAAGLSGQLLSNALQNVWVLSATALLFALLALSMFGLYELRLPTNFESRMVNTTNKFKAGKMTGVFIMGALSALIVSPCVAAPLAGALIYISQTHDVVLGGAALFALSMGMSVPLLLVGASAGTLLPKAGPWMETVRNFFGVMMLAVAIWIISPLIPAPAQLLLWASLAIIPAIYLHALDNLPEHANGWMKLGKGLGIMLLIFGAALMIGAFSGAKSALAPLSAIQQEHTEVAEAKLPFKPIKNLAQLENEIQAAKGKIVMLDFYADWCVACKEYEKYTFSDKQVTAALQNAVLLQADVTQNNEDDMALLKHFGLFGPPGIIFFDKNGNELNAMKVIGYQEAPKFLTTVDRINNLKGQECDPLVVC